MKNKPKMTFQSQHFSQCQRQSSTQVSRVRRRIAAARSRFATKPSRRANTTFVFLSLALAIFLTPSVSYAQPSDTESVANAVRHNPDEDAYRIGFGDVLEVRVFNRPQLSRDAVRVDNRGLIRMPMIDTEIRAACRTESELANEIANLYLPYQRHPQVDVFIKEYTSKPVAVMGAVDKPGQFQLQRRVRLLELLSLAGGPTERAGQRVLVTHTAETSRCGEVPATSANGFESYDINDILKSPAGSNPYVRAGDMITIPEAQQVFVVGSVFKPTNIPLKEKITVSQAVAMAGGVMPDAKKTSVRVLRQSPGASTKTEMIVDLTAINKRKADDLELLPNDIVEVPTSSGKRFLRTLMGTVAPTAYNLPLRVIR